ncbi:MAG: arginine--tRNA ligase [Verrucomicrobia bacterium]|nr:arginine--tRNA ligase [Verrucomicrobiota bacterium]
MPSVVRTLQARLGDALARVGLDAGEAPIPVTPTAEARFGDYQTNVGMTCAKRLGQNPRVLAGRILQALDVADLGPPPEIAGPGFINFRLGAAFVARQVSAMAHDERLGVPAAAPPKTIIIDFSSPNIAKPMHVGHIRSTILGDSLARVSRFLGHRVITDNHLGDWGTQFGKVIYGWKRWLRPEALERHPADELVRIYREADAAAKTDPHALELCRDELVKLQRGDPENARIWRECVERSTEEFSRIYQQLGIRFDEQLGESFYNAQLVDLTATLRKQGILEESDGALVYWDRSLSDDPFIIRKSDGGFGYAATDLATLQYRLERWHPDAIWYVVGAPQQLHFKQLFSLARKLGVKVDLEHIAFGSILGEDRKLMRTRSGDSVPLDELLAEAVERAAGLVVEKNPGLPETDRRQVADAVGLGAIKYAELSQYRMTDYVFSWDKLLSLQGNTAPYLQNAYVRSRAIFRKLTAEWAFPATLAFAEPAELALAKKLLQFADVVPAILDGFRPNVLAGYLYELAAVYHAFYEECPVLAAPAPQRAIRLALCETFARVIRLGLDLLGIRVPERM